MAAFVAVLEVMAGPDAPPAGELAGTILRARALVEKEIAPNVPGFAVAVAVDGKLVWSEAFGYADIEVNRPATVTTRFRIGSISKSLTAAGLMRLVDQGLIDLDAPVQQYVPDFPVKPEGAITTRLLAGHLAGVRHYRGQEPFLNRPFSNVQAGLKIFEDDPLVAPPGTQFTYSSFGWALISAVMESAAHRDFLDYMDAEVFQPLGLTHIRPDRSKEVDPERAKFYVTSSEGKFVAAPTVDSSYMWAGGGFLSNAEDLVRFGSAMLGSGFLEEVSRQRLFISQKTSVGKSIDYGIGWYVRKDGKGQVLYYHDGGHHGGTAVLFIRPGTQAVVAIACNLADADIIGRSMKIADLFAPVPVESAATK